jgi:two-component system OmpR family response regulator
VAVMKVLFVDDEPLLADTIRRGLVQHGYAVDVARNGSEGLDAALLHDYDAILLDIMMPGMHGYRVLQELRAAKVWTPVVMLTAKDGEFDQADAFDLGADDYITKPFSFVVLLARLRSLTRRAISERPVVYEVGDLVLDPARHAVWRAGTDIVLTPREFALLEYLMLNSGQALSKEQIADHVWDSAFDGDLNVIEVYIHYLRTKIDAPFGVCSIETLRGIGYRLIARYADLHEVVPGRSSQQLAAVM